MTASMGFTPLSFSKGDLVEYRTGFHGSWRPGFISLIEPHRLLVRDAYNQRPHLIELGKRGKVRALSGPSLVGDVEGSKAIERAERRALPRLTPVIVRTGGHALAVPRPRRRYRSAAYLRFVRTFGCCSCGARAPSEAHHVGERGVGQKADDFGAVPLCTRCHRGQKGITDTGTLPGRSRAETQALLGAEQVRLLIEWAALLAERAA